MRALLLVGLTFLQSCAAAADAPETVSVEYLAEYMVPAGLRFQGACVGGLSAIEYDKAADRYFAVSDSRRGARFFTLSIDLGTDAEGQPNISEVAFDRVTELTTREGVPFPDGTVDPEGFVLVADGQAFVSSEGDAGDGVPPFVDRIDIASGAHLQSAPIPLDYRPWHEGGKQIRGVRPNRGFESLALSPDRRDLYAATESALVQDTGELVAGTVTYARVLHFRLDDDVPRLSAELLYPLEHPQGDIVVHGLVELQALDDNGRLLAMERTFGRDVGAQISLFEVRLEDTESELTRVRSATGSKELPVLIKRPVFDFAELPILLDNFEGLTFGPRLADGSESLLVLGDNDNVQCKLSLDLSKLRPTKLLLFRLRR